MSLIIFIEGSGGYIKVLRTINSFKMSFCIVPCNYSIVAPCSKAATMYIARMGSTAPFMVMDTEISLRGMLSKRIFISSTESMATPAIPTSPTTLSWSES